jgi:hypothetical protein
MSPGRPPTKARNAADLGRRSCGLRFGTHVLALADKAVVSGTSLLSIVLVARRTMPSELGRLTLSAVRIRIAARGPGRADPASVQARVTCDIILVRILFAMGRPARAGMENVRPTI